MLTSEQSHDIGNTALDTAATLRQNGLKDELADALANGPRHPDAYLLSRCAYLGALSFGFMLLFGLMLFFYRPMMVCGGLTANAGTALLISVFAMCFLAAGALYAGTTKLSKEGRSALFLKWIEEEGSGNGFYFYFVGKIAREGSEFESGDAFIKAFMARQLRVTLWFGLPLALLAMSAFAFLPSTCLA